MKSVIYTLLFKSVWGIQYAYIGSTFNKEQRFRLHKSEIKNNTHFCKEINRNLIKWEDIEVIILEENDIKTKRMLAKREQYYIDWLKPNANERNAYIELENDETYLQNYYKKNKEKIIGNSKKSYETHKEEKVQYNKDYRTKNKDKIKAVKSQKTICECGKEVSRGHKARHIKSAYHIKHTTSI